MINGSLDIFFSAIRDRQSFIRDFENSYAKKLAVRFNSLDFISWNENKVSSILAYFLNPKEGHGQGDIYLKLFINAFDLQFTYSDVSQVTVKVEEATDTNRRIDIVVSYKNRERVFGIENKIYAWTIDRKDQVKDYLQFLKQDCSTTAYQLVYLAPKSKILTEYSAGEDILQLLEGGQLIIINYEEHIIKLIRQFVIYTENERVRCFLQDFERKLTEKYIGNENLDGKNMIANYIKENKENLKMAFAVANSLNGLKEQLKSELSNQMVELAEELQIEFDMQHNHFALKNLKKHYVKYNFEMGGVIYGLVKTPDYYKVRPDKIFMPELTAHLGIKFKTSYWWPLYYQQYYDIDTNEELWIDIKEYRLRDFIKNFLHNILELPSEMTKEL